MPGSSSYDVIVIGVGSMGSSACYYLARQGLKVLGIEQFDIVHEFGAHAGQSRIIRKAYFEHSDYVPLLTRAYDNWKELEELSGMRVYYKTGLLYAGKPSHVVVKGVKESASLYKIPIQKVAGQDLAHQFPQFSLPSGFEVLFEPEAGFLLPATAIEQYAKLASTKGATIHANEKVIQWKKEGTDIIVTTNKQTYQSKKLVITTGPWAGEMIPGMNKTIKVTRQFVAWARLKKEEPFSLHHFPCWLITDDKAPGAFYGFPSLPIKEFGPPAGLKIAHHYPGSPADPNTVNRQATEEDIKNITYALNKFFPGSTDGILSTKICLYANTPDENFIIDNLPGYEEEVTIACGFSGHGFKFVSVVGEILAELVINGKSKLPIGFLRANRFG